MYYPCGVWYITAMGKSFPCPVGKRFGRVSVLGDAEPLVKAERSHRTWLVRCDCGSEFSRPVSDVNAGRIKQCYPCRKATLYRHGEGKNGKTSKEYRAWGGIKKRCYSTDPRYGGRGISFHQAWADDYPTFLAGVGRAPSPKHQLDRINNNGNYEPGNVRWVTPTVNARNKRSNRLLTANGETLPASEWAERLGASGNLVYCRLNRGWTVERAVLEPLFTGSPRGK